MDFDIHTNVYTTVEISDSAKDWISRIDTRGLQKRSLCVNIAKNEADSLRKAKIQISGGNTTQSISVIWHLCYL
ncbi:MAG: BACON domain-containing protein [Bacteroidales bacterium]|nr:BACON domain-containing protein [Bacteroidales bacterium]